METTVNGNELRFRSFRQYEEYFAPSQERINYSGKSDDYAIGAEVARKAFDAFKKRIEDEKKQAPWEKSARDTR